MHGLQQGGEFVHHYQPVPAVQPTGGQFGEMLLFFSTLMTECYKETILLQVLPLETLTV